MDKAINFVFSYVRIFHCIVEVEMLIPCQQNGTNFFTNGATFAPPTLPVLLQIMSGAQAASDLLPSGDIYVLPSNATIELSFPATVNAPGAPHPFHLHGVSLRWFPCPHLSPFDPVCRQHTFAVVRSAGSSKYNYENPIWRDVVSTGTVLNSDNVTIRFRVSVHGTR